MAAIRTGMRRSVGGAILHCRRLRTKVILDQLGGDGDPVPPPMTLVEEDLFAAIEARPELRSEVDAVDADRGADPGDVGLRPIRIEPACIELRLAQRGLEQRMVDLDAGGDDARDERGAQG